MELKLTITTAGLSECVDAKSRGIKLDLTHVSAGDKAYTPSQAQTTLANEKQRVAFGEYKKVSDTQLQAVAKFSGPEEYPIKELGFWLESGTLLGVISAPDTILNYKPKDGHAIQPFTLDLSVLPSETINVVVGTENLNILMSAEFAQLATASISEMLRGVKRDDELKKLNDFINKLK